MPADKPRRTTHRNCNSPLDAVIRTRFDLARKETAGDLPDGPFRGVPILHKDLGCMVAGQHGVRHRPPP